jgi:hypothetical protein
MYAPNRVLSVRVRRLGATLGVLALVGLVSGAAFAFAGSPGDQGGPAYALVNPNNGSPQLVAGHTSGFTAVSLGTQGQGDYCLTAAPWVDLGRTAAVASQEAFYSDEVGFVLVRYQPNNPDCNPNQLEVKTFNSDVTALTSGIAFTVNVR